MNLTLPELCLVLLVGPSGCGKSTFAAKHFKPTEVLSSDFFRGLVSDDVEDQSATTDAFDVLQQLAAKRLARGRLTVIDATNVRPEARKPLVRLAHEHDVLAAAIVLNIDPRVCQERNRSRAERTFGPHVMRQQADLLRRSLRHLRQEGFRYVYVLDSPEAADAAAVERTPLWTDRRHEHGPFDIIGDVHGCMDELNALLNEMGYELVPSGETDGRVRHRVIHPKGRKVVFLGDLVDRGPDIPGVLGLAMDMMKSGAALCVNGNHEAKLLRALDGRNVQVTHGLAESLDQLGRQPEAFVGEARRFLDSLISHYMLDDGKLAVAHAGIKQAYQGRASGRVRSFCLYGDTSGETDELGLPVRHDWAAEYRGKAAVVYGHTPVAEPKWVNHTINVDTGCVFGGRLTALRYPEMEFVSVPAARVYYEPARPVTPPEPEAPALEQREGDALYLDDVMGRRVIETRLRGNVTVRGEQAAAALEVMGRFAVDPRWLAYLPTTMAPAGTSREPGLLEHPAEAFQYYRKNGVQRVVCEEKHMGSRAVIVLCKDERTARERFGPPAPDLGICYTRTGRRFFDEPALETGVLARLAEAMEASGLWRELETDWAILDCEIMPWSLKAQELLREQYAAAAAAGKAGLTAAVGALQRAADLGVDTGEHLARHRDRLAMVEQLAAAYRRYAWPVSSLDDLRVAPFHLLAVEGRALFDKDHLWHMGMLGRLSGADPALLPTTAHRVVDLEDADSEAAAVRWWEDLTAAGGEGMVIKPLEFIATGRRGLVQPALKCRGAEYLRIIYGPEYDAPGNLERLRKRSVAAKQSLALREFSLGVEALDRFVRHEPLYRVHECVFGVLALESEPLDPRL